MKILAVDSIALRCVQILGGKTDEAYLEEYYDRNADALFRYALAITGCADDAEDAVQDVFARLARDMSRVKKLGNIRAYLFSATRNSAYGILRSRLHRNEVSDEDVPEHCAQFSDDGDLSVICREALEKLPVEQREVLVLKVFDGMTFKEIADMVGASENTVASRYRYGIASLRRMLDGEKYE